MNFDDTIHESDIYRFDECSFQTNVNIASGSIVLVRFEHRVGSFEVGLNVKQVIAVINELQKAIKPARDVERIYRRMDKAKKKESE